MATATISGCSRLVELLDRAVARGGVEDITYGVRDALTETIGEGVVDFPPQFKSRSEESYARRLIHRNPDLDYTVLAMVWGPSQGTPLHDHSGMWCVEGVLEGRIAVTHYELLEQAENLYRFRRHETLEAGTGSAGRLIPPYDHHTISNPHSERSAVTIHVYGGEMFRCNIFEPRGDDWYAAEVKTLAYTV